MQRERWGGPTLSAVAALAGAAAVVIGATLGLPFAATMTAGAVFCFGLRWRSRAIEPLSLVMPSSDEERKHTNLSAFAPEWSSSLDSVYDALDRS